MLEALATSIYFFRIIGPVVAAGLYLAFGYSAPMTVGAVAIFANILLIRRFLQHDQFRFATKQFGDIRSTP
jgi:membrane protein implicated in regulation of membrane protease activity